MAYSDIYNAATVADHSLRKQIAVAIHKAAVDVGNEAENTANHANRLHWANQVLANNEGPQQMAGRWIWKVLENATIQSAPAAATDSDVQFVVNSIVDTMANITR